MPEKEGTSTVNPDAEPRKEFVVRVGNWPSQILLKQFALSRGIPARVPGRSRRRVVLQGSECQVRELLRQAARLGMMLERRRLEVVEKFLEENSLEVPLELDTALAMLEIKTAIAGKGCHRSETRHGG